MLTGLRCRPTDFADLAEARFYVGLDLLSLPDDPGERVSLFAEFLGVVVRGHLRVMIRTLQIQ
jgi:hypothetical protein